LPFSSTSTGKGWALTYCGYVICFPTGRKHFNARFEMFSKEYIMNEYSKLSLTLAALCGLGSCLIGLSALLVIMIAGIDSSPGEPFYYYQEYHFPLLSVLLPVLGMLLFAAVLLINKRDKEVLTLDELHKEVSHVVLKENVQEERRKAA
jgi:hypothetical protein